MTIEFQDPFADSSLPSLLPLTLAPHSLPPSPAAALRSLLGSMALKDSEKAVAQAKEISRSRQGAADSSQNGEDVGRDHQQARRPALGRNKTARFSIKPPVPRKPVANVDSSSQLEHIEDPEEYFIAFEKQENADKELKKLRGEVSADLSLLSPTARQRRPGISGRTASYKHQFSADDTAEAINASQEAVPDAKTSSSPKASKLSMLRKTSLRSSVSPGKHPEASKDEGLGAEKDRTLTNHLEQLLPSIKDLSEAQIDALLRERLKLKNIDPVKINLPQMPTNGTNDMRKSNNNVTGVTSPGGRLLHFSSATAKSPVAAGSKPVNPVEEPSKMYPNDDARSSNSHLKEYLISPSARMTSGSASKSTARIEKRFNVVEKLRRRASEAAKSSDGTSDTEDGISAETQIDNGKDTILDEMLSELPNSEVANGVSEKCDNVAEDGHVSGTDVHSTSEGVDFTMQESQEVRKVAAAAKRKAKRQRTGSKEHRMDTRRKSRADHSTVVANDLIDGLATLGSHATLRNDKSQEAHKVGAGAKRKQNKHKTGSREHKMNARRNSLADAGLTWESGVRKSTRIRSRPLNFWLGERFLYGRIHDSLTTVIGRKIAMPGKDGRGPEMKIESFVSEEHADLVSRAADH